MKHKTETSKVGAISKAQKAQSLEYAQDIFMKNAGNAHAQWASTIRAR